MKYTIAILSMLALTACVEDERPVVKSDSDRSYRVECVDGIEYWVRHTRHKGYMAVRVDPDTMSFVRCNTDQTRSNL
jgi:hypothetical protein